MFRVVINTCGIDSETLRLSCLLGATGRLQPWRAKWNIASDSEDSSSTTAASRP